MTETASSFPPIPPARPFSIAELLDRAFRLYRRRFRRFLSIAALLVVPYALISGLVTGTTMSSYLSLLAGVMVTPEMANSPEVTDRLSAGLGGYFFATLALSLAGVAIFLINTLSLTSHALAEVRGRPEAIRQSLRTAIRRFWPALRMNLIKFGALIVIGLALGIALFFMAGLLVVGLGAAAGFQRPDADPGVLLILVGGFLLVVGYLFAGFLFVAPIVYLAARWQVALPGIIDQEWNARQSLGSSWKLTIGQSRRAVGYLILLWALSLAITTVPAYLVQSLAFALLGSTGNLLLVTALSSAMGTLLYIFWQPLAAIAVTLLYLDLRVRQEGLDIEDRIAQLEAELGENAPVRSLLPSTEVAGETRL